MNYTVNQLAKLSSVTVRTLRFYDEIGLLKPAFIAENGYRYYQEKELLLLQQILFFRELGFELKQIQQIMAQDDFDRLEALRLHKKILRQNIDRMTELMRTVDTTINHLEGKTTMNEHEIFKGFAIDSEQQKKYEKELAAYLNRKHGAHKAQEEISAWGKKVEAWTEEDWQASGKEFESICKGLVMAIEKNLKPDSHEVQEIIRRHYTWLKRFWTPTKESYAGHADVIVDTNLRKAYQRYHPELAYYIAAAIKVFAAKELQ